VRWGAFTGEKEVKSDSSTRGVDTKGIWEELQKSFPVFKQRPDMRRKLKWQTKK
jgi:hypothetical protein